MSQRYSGGFITKNYVAPTPSAAPGVWTLDQQMQAQKAGTWPFGGPFNYIEDVFSTYLYTGNGATQTITNNIDLAGKGGLVWVKSRTNAFADHALSNTVNGTGKYLSSNTDSAQTTTGSNLTAFNADGFTVGTRTEFNQSGANLVSWTFREQPKFFDVVTYTGNTTSGRQIPHSLGSVPGCIIIKRTSGVSEWQIWHKDTYDTHFIGFNTSEWANGGPSPAYGGTGSGTALGAQLVQSTSTVFQVDNAFATNRAGETYVAYLFAHNAGGFGATATDNVISCGSYMGNGSTTGPVVTLGYEPQWLLIKKSSGTSYWHLLDSMRGLTVTNSNDAFLYPNTSEIEDSTLAWVAPSATGFDLTTSHPNLNENGATYIYIAIRRGPMKVPTDGTKVFSPNATTSTENTKITTGFPVDLQMQGYRAGLSVNQSVVDRLRGVGTLSPTNANSPSPRLSTSSTAAEASVSVTNGWDNTGFQISSGWDGNNMIYWNFGRAPGFFDEVCYTQTSTSGNQVVAHNLTVAPELVIIKSRNEGYAWNVWPVALNNKLILNQTTAASTFGPISGVTSTSFLEPMYQFGTPIGTTYVAYLFATCPGVSKVGSYTGTGATQTIPCGFVAGARFVLIKRTDSTGNWYVWDTARGMVAGTDPKSALNLTSAETNADWVYTAATGFQIVTADASVNASGGTYIFLAIA